MSLVQNSDVIANLIKTGTWDFKVVNDSYSPESDSQRLADFADASLGLANALSDGGISKLALAGSISSTALAARSLANGTPETDDLYYQKLAQVTSSSLQIITEVAGILSKIPAPCNPPIFNRSFE